VKYRYFLLSFKNISRNRVLFSIRGFIFKVSIVIGFGSNSAISTPKIMKIIAIRKNRDENGNRAEFFGRSNPHTEHKEHKFFCVDVECLLL